MAEVSEARRRRRRIENDQIKFVCSIHNIYSIYSIIDHTQNQIHTHRIKHRTKDLDELLVNSSVQVAIENGCLAIHGQTWDKNAKNAKLMCIHSNRYVYSSNVIYSSLDGQNELLFFCFNSFASKYTGVILYFFFFPPPNIKSPLEKSENKSDLTVTHPAELCEKCKRLGHPCTRRYF